MGSIGTWQNATISAGGFKSAEIDLEEDAEFLQLLASSIFGFLYLEVAEKTEEQGGTYYRLGHNVTTGADGFNRADVWTLGRFRYIRICISEAPKADLTIRIRPWRN